MEEVVVAGDVPTLKGCLSKLSSQLGQVNECVAALKECVRAKSCLQKGVDLLELKNQLLLSYLVSLSYVVLVKTEGMRELELSHFQVVERLVEIRTVLEKLRPLESRFSYQLDKLLRIASSGVTSVAHPTQFRPAPHKLVSKLPPEDMSSGESSDERGVVGSTGSYVPPRVLAVPYKEEKKQGPVYFRSRLEQSKVLSELRNEWSDLPAEVETSEVLGQRSKHQDEAKERECFEEEYFVRLPNRDGKTIRRHQEQLSQLTNFSTLQDLTDRGRNNSVGKKGKVLKRKSLRKQRKRPKRRKH